MLEALGLSQYIRKEKKCQDLNVQSETVDWLIVNSRMLGDEGTLLAGHLRFDVTKYLYLTRKDEEN